MERKKEIGTLVTWFENKAFGFVHQVVDGEVRSYFVHISQVAGKPKVGDTLRFEVGEGRKGPAAKNVEIVPATETPALAGMAALLSGKADQ
jgi:cold shock CspA family protein